MANLILGGGLPGPKTRRLLADEAHIRASGLGFPNKIAAITPAALGRFLMESGALMGPDGADLDYLTAAKYADPEKVKKRIMNYPFSRAEREMFIEAALSVRGESRIRPVVLFRSDENEGGTGILHSGAVVVSDRLLGSKEGLRELSDRIEMEVRLVLASDWSPDAIAFRRLKGTSEPTGILLMSLYGSEIQYRDYDLDSWGRIHTYAALPALSINYLRDPNAGAECCSVGIGMGGANSKSARHGTIIGKTIVAFLESPETAEHWNAINLETGGIVGITVFDMLRLLARNSRWAYETRKIQEMFGAFIQLAGPRYLEIIIPDCNNPDEIVWMVVQSAQIGIPKIEKPELPDQSKMLTTRRVLGTKIVRSNRIRLAYGAAQGAEQEDEVYNDKEGRGHVLVIDINRLGCFSNWRFHSLSNAGAVVLNTSPCYEKFSTYASHLGGWAREAGIPILCGGVNEALLEKVKREKNQVLEANCVVYADEFGQNGPDGFLAVE